jgi:uncharacterized membrane protein YbaN (DUF454 family)
LPQRLLDKARLQRTDRILKEQQANTMYFAIAALGLVSLATAFMLELEDVLARSTMIMVFLTGTVIWVAFEKSLPFSFAWLVVSCCTH